MRAAGPVTPSSFSVLVFKRKPRSGSARIHTYAVTFVHPKCAATCLAVIGFFFRSAAKLRKDFSWALTCCSDLIGRLVNSSPVKSQDLKTT